MKITQLPKAIKSYWQYVAAGIALVGVVVGIIFATTNQSRITETKQPVTRANSQLAQAQAADITTDQPAPQTSSTTRTTIQKPRESTPASSSKTAQTQNSNPFAQLNLSAESVMVWDQSKQETIFARNPGKEHPLASLTKLMTALVAQEKANDKASSTASISRQHLQAHGEYNLQLDQSWSLSNLIAFMLVESSNDAARAVAAASSNSLSDDGYASEFVDKMNETATELGLQTTYFFNPSGLDINEELISGGYGSAHDMVQLFSHIITHYPELLTPTTKSSVQLSTQDGMSYTAQNTNTDINKYPNALGSKTGYTVLAEGNLVMGFDLSRPIIITVLGSTKEGRFRDMNKLYNATRQWLNSEQQRY